MLTSRNGTVVIRGIGPVGLMGISPLANEILFHLLYSSTRLIVILPPVQFFYRYMQVCRSYQLSTQQYCSLLAVAIAITLVGVGINTYGVCSLDEEKRRVAEAIFFNGTDTPELAYMTGPVIR